MLRSIEVASDCISSGAATIGWVVSKIVILWVAVALLPDVSVAVHVTMVSPSGNASGASLVIEVIPEISSATISP